MTNAQRIQAEVFESALLTDRTTARSRGTRDSSALALAIAWDMMCASLERAIAAKN